MSPHPTIAPAQPQCGVNSPRSTSRVSVSKKWVLPPRPKPGRKPKAREPVVKEVLLKPQTGSTSPASSANREISFNNTNTVQKDEQGALSPSSSASNLPSIPTADDCGLCTKTECICSSVGLKKSTPIQPQLEEVLNSVPHRIAAVPLKHANTSSGISKPKLKRASAIKESVKETIKETILQDPYSSADFSTGCGFCTDDSSCVCDQALKPSVLTPRNSVGSSPHDCTSVSDQPASLPYGEDVIDCQYCQDSLSMLFCLSLSAAQTLRPESVAIPHYLALKTLQKHGRFATCDLGMLVSRLEVDSAKMVGVQSINTVLHDLDSGVLS